MKVLIYEGDTITRSWYKQDIRETFTKMGIPYDAFEFNFCQNEEEKIESCLRDIRISDYDVCFSINYFPELSRVCYKNNTKYIAWGYDCPFNVRDIEQTLGNPCNYVFCFDRNQAEGYQKRGYDTVYYLPLAVNVDRYMKMNFSERQLEKYSAQVSFVGNLYEGEYSRVAEICDRRTQGYLEGIIDSQLLLYGAYILNDVISDSLVESINKHFQDLQPGTKFFIDKPGLVHILDQETSRRERLLLLGVLGRRFDTHVYTYKTDNMLKNVKCHGRLDYFSEMPLAFAASKINLNITVKGIQTGMPLRVFDVMASGGFLLSNYQSELVEFFNYGEDLVVYESIEDAYEKCKFYLEHEELRKQIAGNGQNRVFTEYNMTDRIRLMLEVAGVE